MEKNNEPTQSSGSADMASNMPNVPSLECDLPATARIEIYAPGDGHAHSRLDGVNYVCAQHLEQHLEVLSWDSGDGYTHHVVNLPEDVERRCGTGFDFVAMARTQIEGEQQAVRAMGCSAATVDLLLRLDRHLRDVERRERKAFASGYIQGVTARLTGTGHAFTVVADDTEADKFNWLCRCGWMTIQYPAGTEQDPIHKRLTDHVFVATAVDERTAVALEVEGCSCPAEIPEGHKHILYVRRLASTGKLAHIVVRSNARGSSRESLCWPISEAGIARAQEWCDRHGAEWDNGERVKAGDLIARGQGWLS